MIKKILTSKVFLVIILIGLSLLTFRLVKITKHEYRLKSELKPLNDEIKQIKKEKEKLSKNFEYFKSESYLEKEARTRLNLKKEGEQVVIISPGDKLKNQDLNPSLEDLTLSQGQMEGGANSETNQTQKEKSKTTLWWNYFFGD